MKAVWQSASGARPRQRLTEARRRLKRRTLDILWPMVLSCFRRWLGRRSEESGAISVVTVNYHSNHQLHVLLGAIAKFTDVAVRVIVIDNASTPPPEIRTMPERIRLVRLPINILHGPALDLGVLLCDTEFVVTLDVDAFPIAPGWLDAVIDPLKNGAELCGGAFPQAQISYAHPCFLALRRRSFIESRNSFREIRRAGQLLLDVGAALTVGAQGEVIQVPATSVRGPGFIGTTYGDSVYHNFYGTRLKESSNLALRELERQSAAAWDEAVEKYLSPSNGPDVATN